MITFSPAIPLAQAAVAAASIGCVLATDHHGGAIIQPAACRCTPEYKAMRNVVMHDGSPSMLFDVAESDAEVSILNRLVDRRTEYAMAAMAATEGKE